jgi:hypothetical protein
MKYISLLIVVTISINFYTFQCRGQNDSTNHSLTVNAGVDVLSNFIWRGVALDPYPCLQPSLSVGNKNIEAGFLGSYSLGGFFNATPIYLKYSTNTKVGNISLMLFDYYYPFKKKSFDNFKNKDGAHTLEASLTYKHNTIPIKIFVSTNLLNDSLNSNYAEVRYKVKVKNYALEFFTGASLTKHSNWLGAEDAGITNVGLSAIRDLYVSKNYSIPVTASYSVHTQLKYAYLSAKISFKI